ncbi:MAG TPA: hypothetical protein VMZ53_11435 [Kofleriaceae bacterium]|nr:hypothetical protein [Kofleriaceae bacterium]
MWTVAIALAAIVGAGCGRFGFGADDPGRDAPQVGDGGTDVVTMGGDGGVDAPEFFACTGSEVCEGFESGFGVWMADAMVSLDATRAHRGNHSVHVHSPAFAAGGSSYQAIYQSQTVSANINPFWVRGWFWLSARPNFDNAMELMTAERPSTSSGDYVFVHADSTNVYSQFDAQIMQTSTLVPVGQWFCLIWKVTRNTGTSGALELSGDVTVSLANTKTDSTTSSLQIVVLGIGYASSNTPVAQPAQDLWIDDVIVSASAVTCSD